MNAPLMSLREVLVRCNLTRVADQIAAAAKSSVRLQTSSIGEAPATRIGGRPNLPTGIEWPTWHDKPLGFVGQIDLASFPQIPGLRLPTTGALHFFYEGGEEAWGFRPEDTDSCRVYYTAESIRNHPIRNLPKDIPDFLRFKPVQLSLDPIEITVPGTEDAIVESLGLTGEERESYWDFLEAWDTRSAGVKHRVGGYPDCVQGDPKLEAQLVSHGLYCGDRSGYETGKSMGLYPGASEWELLLQVDSDEEADMMWGDVGRIYFLMRKDDLEQARFEKTWLVFQCY